MSITPSSASAISLLIADLASDDESQREAAIARLSIIGPRAVARLLATASDATAPTRTRVAALNALESIGASRAATLAHTLLAGEDDGLAIAAAQLLGKLARGRGAIATSAFDRLTACVLDTAASPARRLAALGTMNTLPAELIAPIHRALQNDPSPELRERVTRTRAGTTASLDAIAAAPLPDDPTIVAARLHDEGETASVTLLNQLLDAVRAREGESAGSDAQAEWRAIRGSLHQQLAARGSRLALYDIREALAHAEAPLPVGFVSAVTLMGDASCLDPIAQAWVQSAATAARPQDRWWRGHLADAFATIARREALTRRHAVIKRVLERYPAAIELPRRRRRIEATPVDLTSSQRDVGTNFTVNT